MVTHSVFEIKNDRELPLQQPIRQASPGAPKFDRIKKKEDFNDGYKMFFHIHQTLKYRDPFFLWNLHDL